MGVAEGVIDRVEPTIRQEVVVHDDAPSQILRDRAPLLAGAIEGEGEAQSRMQPLQLAWRPGCVDLPGATQILAAGIVIRTGLEQSARAGA
jgi:hypothetical protein